MLASSTNALLRVDSTFELAHVAVGIHSTKEDRFVLCKVSGQRSEGSGTTLTWFMPALANKRVGSLWGTTGEEGQKVWGKSLCSVK